MKHFSVIGVTLAALACVAVAAPVTEGQPPPKVPLAAPPVAQAFSLHDVRLLDGVFKTGQDIAVKYLLSLEPDRFLANFRKESGLEPRANRYGGWEAQGIAGHSLGHYLSACALAYAATGDKEFLKRVNYMVEELAECQKANGDGYLAAIPGGKKCYAEVAAGIIRSAGFDLNGVWVPNYTMHKVFAGLRDAYRLCGNMKALEIAKGLADWFEKTHAGLNEEQMQKILAAEHGGLNETFADLYADTGDERYLKLSRRLHHKAILDPLARGEDILPGKHANTQIPKLIGLATRYEIAGSLDDRAAADFFWERVVRHHSYVTGGHCDAEHFGQPDKLNDRLSPVTTETCNVYNMLKLTEHVFGWNPNASTADFYERALLNHIRSSQHPDGRVIYNLSLKPGHHKEYQSPYDGFTCCVGTGMENHVKYGEGIYFHNDDNLWVNLFIASEVNWKWRGVTVRQETKWPDADRSTLTIKCDKPQEFTLRIRRPFWATAFNVKVNGRTMSKIISTNGYCEVKREWQSGDEVKIAFPMGLRTEAMPDNPKRIAIFYGPTLLAGDIGSQRPPRKVPVSGKYEDGTPVVTIVDVPRDPVVPCLLAEADSVSSWVKRVPGRAGVFRTRGVGRPFDVDLVPFHSLHDRNYTVYWDLFTESGWKRREAEYLAQLAEERKMDAHTVDVFRPGEMQSERDHNVKGDKSGPVEALGRKLRHAWDGGWFSYEMKVDPTITNELVCTWWGSESGRREFDILVNDTKIATQKLLNNKPGQFWDASYPIPAELTRGKEKVTVKFQAQPENYAGGLFGSRMLRR